MRDNSPFMTLRSTASWLLLLLAVLAPWLVGAQSRLPGIIGACSLFLVALLFLVVIQRAREHRWPLIPKPVIISVAVLLGCLAWWATQPEPPFATPFAAENYAWIQDSYPAGLLQMPRMERLVFLACLLGGFLAAVDLSHDETFRRRLCLLIGSSGLAIGVYALGIRWLGLPLVPWAVIDGGTERYDVSFFHHCGPAACLNVAWVLIFFSRPNQRQSSAFAILSSLAILVLVALAQPLWRSQSAGAVAGGIFVAGLTWTMLQRRGLVTPARVRTALALFLTSLFAWQAFWAWRSLNRFPDHWVSAAQTRMIAPIRDARIRALAMQRGDRLAFSAAPARPIAWIAAGRMAMDYPLLGLGPGSWVRIIPLYSNEPLIQTFFQHRQFAHHDLLQTAAEWGIVPALLFLGLWIGGLWRATANTDPPTAEGMNVTLALVVLAVHSTLHFPLQIPALQIWAALLLAAAWSTPARPTPAASTQAKAF